MQITDLVFLVAMLATLVTVIRAIWRLIRGPRRSALRILQHWALGAVAYAVLLIGASLTQGRRTVAVNEDECFDDWCIAVVSAERQADPVADQAASVRTTVTLRISNRGRGRPQAEPDAYVYLLDDRGREIRAATPGAAMGGMDTEIGGVVPAGESRVVTVAFDVPREAVAPVLVKARPGWFPSFFIIGDPVSLLHGPTVHALPPV